jgi:DNA polymerase elongation subunit (family B)
MPESWSGPFVVGHYDRSRGCLYLKRETDAGSENVLVPDVYPAIFIPRPQIKKFPGHLYKERIVDVRNEGAYVRVTLDSWTRRRDIDELLEECFARRCYPREADVPPIRRWFSDTGAQVSPRTRALFFDLETHPLMSGFSDEAKAMHRVISWAAMDQDGNTWFDAARADNDEEEERVMRSFFALAADYDTLLAWNGDNYDFFVLRERAKQNEMEVHWDAWNWLDYMGVVKKCLMSISEPSFKRSFNLDAVGENVLGIRKLKPSVPMDSLHLLLGERVKELEDYNTRDVEIMVKLEEKHEFLKLHLAVCSICRMFPGGASLYPNALADGMMLRLAVQEGRHFRSRHTDPDVPENKFEGAYVMDAILGFHSDVQVIDFASLYPSIMISWNMSPDTKLSNGFTEDSSRAKHDTPNSQEAVAPSTGVVFRTDRVGMLPLALKRLLTQRKVYAEKAKAEAVGSEMWKIYGHMSTGVKVVANSMYGLLGSPYSRYFDRDIARSVTLTGQYLIKSVITFLEDRGHKVIAGDTDSCFVRASESDTSTEIEAINSQLIPKLLGEAGCIEHTVKMDFDKGYRVLLIQAKKKYAGRLSLYKGKRAAEDIPPDIKGLEFQRSDQIRIAQRMQMHFVEKLLDPDANPLAIEQELREWGERFFFENVPRSDIEITQSVSKHPSQYDPPGPAPRVALKMIEEGVEFFVGMKVPYIIVESQPALMPIHADKYDGKFDREYYWTQKVLPPVQRLFDARFPEYQLGDLKKKKTRMSHPLSNPGQGMLRFGDTVVKQRKVKATPKVRKVKKPVTTICIDNTPGDIPTIKGIAKLVRACEKGTNRIQLSIRIELDEGPADVIIMIPTEVTKETLRNIKKLFPWVEVTPEPI